MKAYLAINPKNETLGVVGFLKSSLQKLGVRLVDLVEEADLIFSIGGDGTLLYNIYRYLDQKKPFVGVNAGSVGFLCYVQTESLEKDLLTLFNGEKTMTFGTFRVFFEGTVDLAIQDLRIERPTHAPIRMRITNNGQVLAKNHIGDGILITGALGSTAYNLSAGGPIIPLSESGVILTPICPFGGGKKIYDSLLKPQIFPTVDVKVVSQGESRLVLDNRGYLLPADSPVRIVQGSETFELFAKRQ
ncbi:MAG: hypothetical protein GTO16_10800 [Candidatus Aminicenantes bacterium]|nr:hypothetical protein [Candidatus Aminicenantes bacterium]